MRRSSKASSGRGCSVICEEIDLCDDRFINGACDARRGPRAGDGGGPQSPPAHADWRSACRFATCALNRMLRTATGWRGTDTHGFSALRRELMLPVVERCEPRRALASEMVIRAFYMDCRVVEYPIESQREATAQHRVDAASTQGAEDMGKLAVTVRRNK